MRYLRLRDWLLIAGITATALVASYGTAHLGHPSAVWFWRDVLEVLP